MKIKITHAIGLLLLISIVVSGYFLYQQQQKLPADKLARFDKYAENLGLNLQQFNSCLETRKYKQDVENDFNDGRSYGVEGTPTFFVNGKKLVGALSLSEFKTAIDAELANPIKVGIRKGSNPALGSANATTIIVEFSDFQCPFCARVEPTIKQVLREYEGKVKIYYRDFPLNFHVYSQLAAEASRCAGEQGKYWEYHDLLFEKQKEWSGE